VQAWLADRATAFGSATRHPIVPAPSASTCSTAATRPGDGFRHIGDLGYAAAAAAAAGADFALGCAGAGLGATTANFKAVWGRHRPRRRPASRSPRSPWSTRSAA